MAGEEGLFAAILTCPFSVGICGIIGAVAIARMISRRPYIVILGGILGGLIGLALCGTISAIIGLR